MLEPVDCIQLPPRLQHSQRPGGTLGEARLLSFFVSNRVNERSKRTVFTSPRKFQILPAGLLAKTTSFKSGTKKPTLAYTGVHTTINKHTM